MKNPRITCGEDDPRLNPPLNLFINLRELRQLLGKSASRSNVSTLRKYLRYTDGLTLIDEGKTRTAWVDFRVDPAGKAQSETLRAYLLRFLREQGIRVPDGASAWRDMARAECSLSD